jgi:hypothetical protein
VTNAFILSISELFLLIGAVIGIGGGGVKGAEGSTVSSKLV